MADAGSEVVLLEIDNLSKIGWHNGGGLSFGKDGKLYISTGENANGPNAQDSGNLLGKLLRINKDGSIPTDNPSLPGLTGSNRAIVALGLRNPFNIAVQRTTGLLYLSMVGANFEQIESYDTGAAPAAVNYGWPGIDGPPRDQTSACRLPRAGLCLRSWPRQRPSRCAAVISTIRPNPVRTPFPPNTRGDFSSAITRGGSNRSTLPIRARALDFAVRDRPPDRCRYRSGWRAVVYRPRRYSRRIGRRQQRQHQWFPVARAVDGRRPTGQTRGDPATGQFQCRRADRCGEGGAPGRER